MVPGETPADKETIKKANAQRAAEVIRSIDPKGIVFSSSWTWLDKQLWPKESVKAYLDVFPGDSIQIWEQWNDQSASLGTTPMYKDLDYYFGKPWLLGFLFSYGGNTTVHGDLNGLIRRVQEVAQDPKASRCEGISLQPEALRHNNIWFDLLSRLAWNPEKIQLDSFLDDYATRRYGKGAAPQMVHALKELVASVYGADDVTPPFYQVRITEEAIKSRRQRSSRSLSLDQRSQFVPHLRKALEIALEEHDRLGRSPLYQHDLVDIGRQYQGDLFDVYVVRLYDAFKNGAQADFEKQARSMLDLLQDQEALLSSSDFYCLQPILDKAMKLPGVPKDFDEAIRDILTIWRGRILDYARRDYYELVRFYYRPRVDAFIDHLRQQMKDGSSKISQKELEARYQEVEQAFVKKPFKVQKQERYQGTPVEAAIEILKRRQQDTAAD
jgi:alpha-N-acetylglucosaminidase